MTTRPLSDAAAALDPSARVRLAYFNIPLLALIGLTNFESLMRRTSEALQNALDWLAKAAEADDEVLRDECAKLAREWMKFAVQISESLSLPEPE